MRGEGQIGDQDTGEGETYQTRLFTLSCHLIAITGTSTISWGDWVCPAAW